MRTGYAHAAVVHMPVDQDARAVGAAITTRLCGHWEHAGPCPLAPHHTSWSRDGELVTVRVLFASEPTAEPAVRAGIDRSLASEEFTALDGRTVHWRVRSSQAVPVQQQEQEHVERLASDT